MNNEKLIEILVGAFVSIAVIPITSAIAKRFRKTSTKSKLEFINPPSEELSNDPEYKKFNDGIRNEEHMSMILKRPVRNMEIKPLLEFCNLGLGTHKEVSQAWTYREIKNGTLYFPVPKIMAWWVMARYAYAFVCFGLAISLMMIFFVFGDHSAKSASGLIMVIPLMGLAAAATASTSGVRTALRISKKSIKEVLFRRFQK